MLWIMEKLLYARIIYLAEQSGQTGQTDGTALWDPLLRSSWLRLGPLGPARLHTFYCNLKSQITIFRKFPLLKQKVWFETEGAARQKFGPCHASLHSLASSITWLLHNITDHVSIWQQIKHALASFIGVLIIWEICTAAPLWATWTTDRKAAVFSLCRRRSCINFCSAL